MNKKLHSPESGWAKFREDLEQKRRDRDCKKLHSPKSLQDKSQENLVKNRRRKEQNTNEVTKSQTVVNPSQVEYVRNTSGEQEGNVKAPIYINNIYNSQPQPASVQQPIQYPMQPPQHQQTSNDANIFYKPYKKTSLARLLLYISILGIIAILGYMLLTMGAQGTIEKVGLLIEKIVTFFRWGV